MKDNPSTASDPPPLTQGRLTRWEGRDEDGPRAVLVKHDGPFAPILQEALRKLARLEDEEEKRAVEDAGPYTGDMGNE